MNDAVKLAAYREAAERADDTILALRQTIEVLQQAWQQSITVAAEARSEAERLKFQVVELERELAPYKREFGNST
jgi:hypothetical protein